MAEKSKPTSTTIPAVAYCRKSTTEDGYETSMTDQQARISKLRPADSEAKYEIVRWYVKDFGVPGWKRGAKRPDWFKLVQELKETGAKAILVDDADRFSRADQFEVLHEVQELRERHGVRIIHCVNQGSVDLVKDQVAPMRIAMWAMTGHDFCKKLSRRITETRKKFAENGLRSGGKAPYGLRMAFEDGTPVGPDYHYEKGKPVPRICIPGDPAEVKIVKWLFQQFVNHHRSLNWLAGELNRQNVPSPRAHEARKKRKVSGQWHVGTVRDILTRKVYRGDFTFNENGGGEFYAIDKDKNVTPVSPYDDKKVELGTFHVRGKYKPLISPELFDQAEARLASFKLKGTRTPRSNGYALSGILFCGHCGIAMYGCAPGRKSHKAVYRCSTPSKKGAGTCGYYWVDEAEILPYVLQLLAEEITNIEATLLVSAGPSQLKTEKDKRVADIARKADLDRQLLQARENMMLATDPGTRTYIDKRITEMVAELSQISNTPAIEDTDNDEYWAMVNWYKEFVRSAHKIPLTKATRGIASKANKAFVNDCTEDIRMGLLEMQADGSWGLRIDTATLNATLLALGARVTLRWQTEKVVKGSKEESRYRLVSGRFQLGKTENATVMFHKARTGVRSSGSRDGGRYGSRRGKGSMRR